MNHPTDQSASRATRTIFRVVGAPMLRACASLLFNRQYLRGRFFDNSLVGWRWVWRSFWTQKVLGFNRHVPWPVSPFISISNAENIQFDVNDLNNFQTFGCYFQNFSGKIIIGSGSYIAPNVGVITANHDPNDLTRHCAGQDVIIGRHCWIGMNSILLPGVVLGDHTIVGAGAVVTKSFAEGNCTIVGVPAKPLPRKELPELVHAAETCSKDAA